MNPLRRPNRRYLVKGQPVVVSGTYHTVWVIAVPADGAIAFALMLYLAPSIPRVLAKPIRAAFAAAY